jgi:hypothetical protein
MTPEPKEGVMQSAKLDVYHAVRLLDRALVGSDGLPKEARDDILKARVELSKRFGPFEDDSSRFSDAEVASMVARLKGAGSPGQKPPQPSAPPPGGPNPAQPMRAA